MNYAGPPPSLPPDRDWRPEVVVLPAPPRRLPGQDHPALDAAELRARQVTYGVGAGAGLVILIVIGVLLSRALF